MQAVKLRDYQQEYVKELFNNINDTNKRDCVVSSTGSGKTVCMAELVKSGKTILYLAHKNDLLLQLSNKLSSAGVSFNLLASEKIVKKAKELNYLLNKDSNIIVSSKDIILKKRIINPQILVIDECHRIIGNTYQKIIDTYPNTKIIGFTATPERLDKKPLFPTFNNLIEKITTKDLIDQGYLSKYIVYAPTTIIDKTDKMKGKDYDLDNIVKTKFSNIVYNNIVQLYFQYFKNKRVLVYCCNIKHCEELQKIFLQNNIKSKILTSKIDEQECFDIANELRENKIDCILSVNKLIEGTDIPAVDGILMLRPTKSLIIHLQSIGRGMRIAPNKDNLIILDLVGNHLRHGFIDTPRIWSLQTIQKTPTRPEYKICMDCGTVLDFKACSCSNCGYIYEDDKEKDELLKKSKEYKLKVKEDISLVELKKLIENYIIANSIVKAVRQRHYLYKDKYSIQQMWNLYYEALCKKYPEFYKYIHLSHKQKKYSKIQFLVNEYPDEAYKMIEIINAKKA